MDPNQAKPNVYSSERKGISPMALIYIPLAILVVVLVLGVLNYFNILSLSKALPAQLGWLPNKPFVTDAGKQPGVLNSQLPQIPLDPNSPSIKEAEIAYLFSSAKIKNLTPSATNGAIMEVTLPKDETIVIPQLTLNGSIRITKGRPDLPSGSISDLKIGTDINLLVSYNFKNKEWIIRSIYILFDGSAASDSAKRESGTKLHLD